MAKELTSEQQIEALTKEVTALKQASVQKDATILSQKGQIESQSQEIAKLNSTLTEKVEDIRRLNEEAEAAEQVLQAREAKLRAAEVSAEQGKPTVEHEGKHYVIVIPVFQLKGAQRTAADLQNDATLVAELLEQKSGVLREVE